MEDVEYDGLLRSTMLQLSDAPFRPTDVAVELRGATEACVELIAGSIGAAILVISDGDRFESMAATSPLAEDLDRAQRQFREGPCVGAARGQTMVRCDDLRDDERWPRFAESAVAAGVRSMLSFGLFTQDHRVAALNVFGREPSCFGAEAEALGAMLARHCVRALDADGGADAGDPKGPGAKHDFRSALARRDLIGQAKGRIMERFGVDAVGAFELLARLSRDSDTKITQVAAHLAASGAHPDGTETDPLRPDGFHTQGGRAMERRTAARAHPGSVDDAGHQADPHATDASTELAAAVAGRGLTSVFQPIVSLPDESVVGYEALARWPGRTSLAPNVVFGYAAQTGAAERLDRLCIDSAIETAADGTLGPGSLLCINCEAVTAHDVRTAVELADRFADGVQVMFEFTERGLLRHPRALLRNVLALRERGFLIALDDVGAHPDSLALLDVIRPDAIKLDLHLVQAQPRYSQARTLAAVLAHQERTGAVIVAEGIETAEHLEQALALGATLGQGYRFGRPGPLDGTTCTPLEFPTSNRAADVLTGSPFDLIASHTPVRTARKATLMAFSQQLESNLEHGTETPMVFTALQDSGYFTGDTRSRYRAIAQKCPLVVVFGKNLPADLGGGVRGIALDPGDPLCREWTVVVLGAHTAAALIARERDHGGDGHAAEADRRFDFVMTYDRTLVTKAARNLMDRMT